MTRVKIICKQKLDFKKGSVVAVTVTSKGLFSIIVDEQIQLLKVRLNYSKTLFYRLKNVFRKNNFVKNDKIILNNAITIEANSTLRLIVDNSTNKLIYVLAVETPSGRHIPWIGG